MDNLALWNAVETTSPNHVKPITGKSYSGNSPKPYYLVHKATETFGPIGIGWGYSIIDERIEEGTPGEKLSMARVRVWYIWDGKRGEVEHVGGTPFSGKRKNGTPFVDEDAAKKSVTDALVKALSMIGFAGDIFMGRYDDSKYVDDLRREEAAPIQAVPTQPSATYRALSGSLKMAKTINDLEAWKAENEGPIQMLDDGEFGDIQAEYKAKRAELMKRKAA